MYGNLKHAYFSARNPFPIPIKCSISMIIHSYTSKSRGLFFVLCRLRGMQGSVEQSKEIDPC